MSISHRNIVLAALLGLAGTPKAQEWIDMTDLLTNPTFDNDASGWTISCDASNQGVQYGVMEFWNGTFDISQTLTGLADGTYRIGVQAFFRTQDFNTSYTNYKNGTENITAYLYANTASTPVASLLSYSQTSAGKGNWSQYRSWFGGGESSGYYPNDRQSTAEAFSAGAYMNTLEVEVTGGELTLGLRNAEFISNNWCPFDNFTLEYYGTLTPVTSISLSEYKVSLSAGNTYQLTATPMPDDATYRSITWSSSDEDIATVSNDGKVMALRAGTATITATSAYYTDVSASCTVTVTKSDVTSDQLVINEIQVANLGMFIDGTTNFNGWMELYNPTDKAANMGGLYLSDEADNPKKWHTPLDMGTVPAHGYAIVWFDHNGDGVIVDGKKTWWNSNANFSLDPEGGTIYLSDSEGTLLTSQDYPAAVSRTSYARVTDGAAEWSFTAQPTPAASNDKAAYSNLQLQRPEVDKTGQFFEGTLNVSVNIPEGATLRYTTDGSVPTEENGQVSETGFFELEETTVLRLRLFGDGYLPSDVVTRSYIQGSNDYQAPVLSVVGDESYFTDDSIGIFVQGVNGLRGNGQSARCNWNANWERPVSFEYFDGDEVVVAREANMEICGGWSRAYKPTSFKLKGGKEFATYDTDGNISHQSTLDYPFFSAKPYIRNRTLQNRNGGNDNTYEFIDPALQRVALSAGIDLDGQSSQPIVVYRNGQYLCNLNMREPNNKHYVYANYGWSADEIDQFEICPDSNYVQKCGTREAWDKLYSLSSEASDALVYEQIRELLDIDAYINYMAVELYLGGNDWPKNNIKGFRNRADGRFRFVLMDLDFAFNRSSDIFTGFEGMNTWTFDKLYDTYDADGNAVSQLTEEITFVTIFLNLLENDEFRKQFIDQFCLTAGSIYEPNRSAEVINAFLAEKNPPLSYDGKNATSQANSLKNSISNRLSTVTTALKNYSRMQLSGVTAQSVELSQSDSNGTLFVNDLKVPCGYFDGNLFQPVTLRAQAPVGYKFVGWRDMSGTSTSTTLFAEGSDWDYYDNGSLDGQSWTSSTFDTSSWGNGEAPLGYGNTASDFNATLGYGGDTDAKYPTYYFRKAVTLSSTPTSAATFTLNYNVDDGFIVYVNGTEAARYNMPSGTATFDTYASQYNDQNPTGSVTLISSLFHSGENIVAVEVHNNQANSSDIKWDAELLYSDVEGSETDTYHTTEAEFELPTGTGLSFQACYEALSEAEREERHIKPLRVNEVSATNSVLVSDYYKKSDWVEICNTTDEDIDLEGMYLTDKPAKPQNYQITKGSSTASTIVPAHGHKIVWCDKRDPISQLHASFKLDAEGGAVVLTASDLSWADTLYYTVHDGNQSVGRFPDGTDSVYVMDVPTIERTNILSSYDESYLHVDTVTPPYDGIAQIHSDGGLRIYMAGDAVVVRSEDAPTATLTILTPGGAEVASARLRMTEQRAEFPLTMLPAGTYVATAADTEGNRCALKFVMR